MSDPILSFAPVTSEEFAALCAAAARQTGLTISGDSGAAAKSVPLVGTFEIGWTYSAAQNTLALQCLKRPLGFQAVVRAQLVKLVTSAAPEAKTSSTKAQDLGLDRPHPYFKVRSSRLCSGAAAQPDESWTLPALLKAYGWPVPADDLPGGGVIAIVELGGGWVQSDIDAFFASIGQPTPEITDVSVDGTENSPGGDADMEVALDIEVAAGAYYAATGKPATVRVYWSQDIASAVAKAASDGCDVCSISWGADEASWGVEACQQMDAAADAATAAGMVVFAAAGDNDSSDGGTTPANVDCPASCPHITGCGGTSKTAASETVWNDNPGNADGEGTGGGYSTVFPAQAWQVGAAPPPAGDSYGKGRMVPDVAANADPETGYEIYVGGQATVVGGTSAVAPLYAGLFASYGTKLGYLNPKLWQYPGGFRLITEGGNGYFEVADAPSPCTGLGAPNPDTLAGLGKT